MCSIVGLVTRMVWAVDSELVPLMSWFLPLGTLIRRHRIPLPPPEDDQFYTVEHFNVGALIQFYSKTFKITVWKLGMDEMYLHGLTIIIGTLLPMMQACDGFTANFLRKLGVKVPPFEAPPADPYTQHRQKVTEYNRVIKCVGLYNRSVTDDILFLNFCRYRMQCNHCVLMNDSTR